MSEKSLKTRSEASSSSRTSEARQKAALAQLQLSQAQRASELERQQIEKKRELKRQVEQKEMELKKQVERLEQQELELETERKLRAMADHVEECELQARLIEEEENGEVYLQPMLQDESGPQPQVTPVNPRAAFGTNQVRLTADDAGRTARWVSDHNLERIESSPKVTDSRLTWIDALEANGQGSDCMVQTRGVGMRSGPLPPLTLEKFSGDSLQWPRWIALFKALVHDRSELSDAERLAHLQSSLAGPAQLAVSGLLYDGSLYTEALRELQSQFGDRTTVVRANLEKVLQLPTVRNNDIPSLTELSRALHSTVSVLSSLQYDADLAASTNVSAVVAKLPTSLAWKWGEHLQTIQRREPTLNDLNKWLRSQVSAARVVVTGAAAQADGGRGAGRPNGGHKAIRRDRPAGVSAAAATLPPDKGEVERCGFCGGTHRINECEELIHLTVDERVRALMKRAMCFSCLEPGHRASECVSPQKCSMTECASRRHHRLLHGMNEIKHYSRQERGFPPTEDAQLVGTASVGLKDQVLLQIVPVYVHGPHGRRKVNALLDMGSQISLIKEDTASRLGLEGRVQPLRISTVDGSQTRPSRQVNIEIQSLLSEERFTVTAAQTTPVLNVPGHAINWPDEKLKWPHLADLNLQRTASDNIEVLLGTDAFGLIVPREVREGPPGSPAAVRTRLGWVASNRLPGGYKHGEMAPHVNFIHMADDDLNRQLQDFWTTESFGTKYDETPRKSREDERALKMLDDSIRLADGQYETRLMWKRPDGELPDSRPAALVRLKHTERKLDRDKDMARMYTDTIEGYVRDGYAKKLTNVSETPDDVKREWYLPHHGVVNPKKPGKVRVVFDAAARSGGTSLNEELLTGPDLANSLIGVLLRFRQRRFPISADIKAMYHQVRVAEEDQPALRFLWRGADRQKPPDTYQMRVHVFGAASSSCAVNYALQKCAADNELEFPEAAAAVNSRFYVDDYLDSLDTEEEAEAMVASLTSLLKRGGFDLTKWKIPHRSIHHETGRQDLDLDESPIERALGVCWDVQQDKLVFKVTMMDKPCTKRGILSQVSSVFDPLGMLAPYVMQAKALIQDLWTNSYDWDQEIDDEGLLKRWHSWLSELETLNGFQVSRCYFPGPVLPISHQVARQLHVFCDASLLGFGAVAYFRLDRGDGHIWCSFVMAKGRVAPVRQLTVPRLELQSAVMAVRLGDLIKKEHDVVIESTHYWSDSSTVLHWIRSESRRYHTFVANRVAEIQDSTEVDSWRHVPGSMNPADVVSRGCSASELCKDESDWLQGPGFLRLPPTAWPTEPSNDTQPVDCTEEKTATVTAVTEPGTVIQSAKFSSWSKLLRVTAWVRRFIKNCRASENDRKCGPLSLDEVRDAETTCLLQAQADDFPAELDALKRKVTLPRRSRLLPLSPYLDADGLIRVGGRLRHAKVAYENRHQVLLSPSHDVTRLVINDRHRRLAHSGPDHVLCSLRERYWILRGRAAVKRWTAPCWLCKKRRATPCPPMMADLPASRVNQTGPPFSAVGLDFFGPITVRHLRKTEKRYGCIFTCMATRSVHVEIAHTLDTDSFVMALRRMIARRGRPRQIFSDNGTNLKAGERELRKCLRELNQRQITDAMIQEEVDWKFNPPSSPHFGGVWERVVRSVKRALVAIIGRNVVTDEMLLTVMAEVEGLLNSRPLTHVSADPNDLQALTPNHFLIGRASPNLPPGIFDDSDLSRRRRWRHAQRVVDHFWKRWRREYLPELTVRRKWLHETRNLKAGDLVLIAEDNEPRGHWPLARVVRPFSGADGRVRSAEVKTAGGTYVRPVARLCLLEASE